MSHRTAHLRLSLRALVSIVLITSSASAISQGQPDIRPRVDIENLFTPSGWMGDGEYGRKYIEFSGTDKGRPHSRPTSIKVTYRFGPKRWGGIYWQNTPDNWGDQPGNNYSRMSFNKIGFWASGETGEEVVEFKTGHINAPGKRHRDSYGATTGRVTLTKEWKQYTIDLKGADLSSVIGGFCWVASADFNSREMITFYIDDIVLQ